VEKNTQKVVAPGVANLQSEIYICNGINKRVMNDHHDFLK